MQFTPAPVKEKEEEGEEGGKKDPRGGKERTDMHTFDTKLKKKIAAE